MTKNQIEYLKVLEARRSNLANEGLTREKQMYDLDVRSRELEEQKRHNLQTEYLSLQNLGVSMNLAENDRMKANAAITTAESNLMNAQTNATNAQTNVRNAATNERNAEINAYNAQTNRVNAQSNSRQASAALSQAASAASNAATRVQELKLAKDRFDLEKNLRPVESAAEVALTEAKTESEKANAELIGAKTGTETETAALRAAQTETEKSQNNLNLQRIETEKSVIDLNQARSELTGYQAQVEQERARVAPTLSTQQAVQSWEQSISSGLHIAKQAIDLVKGVTSNGKKKQQTQGGQGTEVFFDSVWEMGQRRKPFLVP